MKALLILLLIICPGCLSWSYSKEDVLLFKSLSAEGLRERLKKNDFVINESFKKEKTSKELLQAVHDNIRLYSGCALSPSFSLDQVRITSRKAISFFNPTYRYIFLSKDDLEYFNIHGVLIHESVGHPSDVSVYPLYRIFDIITFSSANPIHVWELRAIACVSAVWRKLHYSLQMPYKPWNLLHPVAGSQDCQDVYDWFFVEKRNWHQAKDVEDLQKLIVTEKTDSIPHLLARIYILVLSGYYDTENLWQLSMENKNLEQRVNEIIIEQGTVSNAMHFGLQKKYLEYLDIGKLNIKKLTEALEKTKPIEKELLKIYNINIGARGIFWYDHYPYGISPDDQITWKFSDFDVFEDLGGDGPNDEEVLGNKDCRDEDYDEIWEKCSKLSEFILRNTK